MLLIFNAFITEKRARVNRYPRMDIFKYVLYSYRNIVFKRIYFFIKLDDNYEEQKKHLLHFIHDNFSYLDKSNIYVEFDRLCTQQQWNPLIPNLYKEFGANQPILFLNNDDHVFVDYDTKLLEEGLQTFASEPSIHKSIYISHWPEVIKLSGKYNTHQRHGNFIGFKLSLLDSVQIFNLQFLHDILIDYKWKHNYHPRIDDILNELTNIPSQDNVLSQIIYIPLKELFRKFDGYGHTHMEHCPPLHLPCNKFNYDTTTLTQKMTAPHHSLWTMNNNFNIPDEWIDINRLLHDRGSYELYFES
jgi:hypothetical protein